MLKFPIITITDLKEAASLQKRQQYEEERKKRIFNAKQRLYGQDFEALDKQIKEKNRRKDVEKECEQKFLDEKKRQAALFRLKEIEQEKEKRKIQSEMNFYRTHYQSKERRREFDLNDPNFHRNSKPARMSDEDHRLGISSAQIFVGEDLTNSERKKAQRQQQRAWLEQQIKERKQAEQDRVMAEKLLQESLNVLDKKVMDVAFAERNNKARLMESTMRYNRELAAQQKAHRKLMELQKNEDDLAEIYNMLGSDMLTENPDVANSPLGNNKKIAFMYRGMTDVEKEDFRKEQAKQLELKRIEKINQEMIDKQFDQQEINFGRELRLKRMEMEQVEKEKREEMYNANKLLAIEQKERKIYLDKNVFVNRASNEFYEQFNRTSR